MSDPRAVHEAPAPATEPTPVDVRGIYSGGYYSGQRLSAYREAMATSECSRADEAADAYFVSLGALHYRDGFSDGWHGRPPAMPLDFRRVAPLQWSIHAIRCGADVP